MLQRSLLGFGLLILAGCPPASGPYDDDLDGFTTEDDCDDSDPNVNPAAAEICANQVDDNCDGWVDDDGQGAGVYYRDSDEDSFGDADNTVRACVAPDGYVGNSDDCDDDDAKVHPRADDDNCDGVDDNCNGRPDDDSAQITVYPDGDDDGFGSQAAETDCAVREGFVENDDDCNDADKDINPDAPERCNGADDNCDTNIDEGISGSGPACAADNCKSILAEQPGATDGTYWLDLGEPYAIECVMEGTGTQGWTVFTGLDLRKLDMVNFEIKGGKAGNWYGEWVFREDQGRFVMSPQRSDVSRTDCETAVVRATTTIPWEFDAWYGEFETEYSGYDNRIVSPGSVIGTCDTGAFIMASGRDYGKDSNVWPLSASDTYSTSWPSTTLVSPQSEFFWEINGYSTSATPKPGEEVAFIGNIRIAVH